MATGQWSSVNNMPVFVNSPVISTAVVATEIETPPFYKQAVRILLECFLVQYVASGEGYVKPVIVQPVAILLVSPESCPQLHDTDFPACSSGPRSSGFLPHSSSVQKQIIIVSVFLFQK